MKREDLDFLSYHGWILSLGSARNPDLGINSPMHGDDAVRLQKYILARDMRTREEVLAFVRNHSHLSGEEIAREVKKRWGK